MSKSVPTGMPECKENFLPRVYNGRIHCSCVTSRYDAEEADPSRRPYDRPSGSAPRGAPRASDHVLMYPMQQQSEASGTRPPASHFAMERSLGPHVSQVPLRLGAIPAPSYSWPPPSSPADPTTPPQSARSSLPWSPSGATYHEPGPATEHESYYSHPQEHPSASPNVNQQRELYYSHQYTRTGPPGWPSQRTPNSPVSAQRRHSSAQPLSSIAQTQTQNQSSYGPPYMESHRRERSTMVRHRVEPGGVNPPKKGGWIAYHRTYDQKDGRLIVVSHG